MGWKPEFKVQGEWCRNGQTFRTRDEAERSAAQRFLVWTLPTEYRAVEVDESANYAHVDWRDYSLECPQCGGKLAVMLLMGVQPDGYACPDCNLYLGEDLTPLATII